MTSFSLLSSISSAPSPFSQPSIFTHRPLTIPPPITTSHRPLYRPSSPKHHQDVHRLLHPLRLPPPDPRPHQRVRPLQSQSSLPLGDPVSLRRGELSRLPEGAGEQAEEEPGLQGDYEGEETEDSIGLFLLLRVHSPKNNGAFPSLACQSSGFRDVDT